MHGRVGTALWYVVGVDRFWWLHTWANTGTNYNTAALQHTHKKIPTTHIASSLACIPHQAWAPAILSSCCLLALLIVLYTHASAATTHSHMAHHPRHAAQHGDATHYDLHTRLLPDPHTTTNGTSTSTTQQPLRLEQHASWLSRLVFAWVYPLMVRGVGHPLQLEDVFQLTWRLRPAVCCDALQRAWEQVRLL